MASAPGAGEARRRAELAQQQPIARGRRVAALDGRERGGERAAEERGAQGAAGGGQARVVAGARGARRGRQRTAGIGVGARVGAADPGGERAAVAPARAGHRIAGLVGAGDDELGLRLEEPGAQRLGRAPGRLGGRGGRRRRQQDERECEGERAQRAVSPPA